MAGEQQTAGPQDEIQYDRVLVPLDGSDLAEAVLPHVRGLAKKFDSEVVLLRAVPAFEQVLRETTPAEPGAEMLAVDVTRRRVSAEHEEADRYLHGIGQRFQAEGIACTERVVEGEAIGEITRYAREHHIDLIAMSTHGRGGLGRLVFGSVADGVLRSAPCPVLVVRSHERHRRRTEELAE